jgi:hypothetical protein
MSIEEINESSTDVPAESTEINSTSAPIEPAEIKPEAAAETTSKWGLNRRKFLTAAALGTAAAAMLNRGSGGVLRLGPATALANDLSGNSCTAGDVEIVGSGIVVNEPCICSPGGTFSAVVQFTVRNNTSTGRYCIALHLVPDGTVITQPTDLVLRDANGSSTAPGKSGGESFHDTTMFATIPNFPCNAGLVCFGQAGVVRGKCAPGTCTTIAWNTSPGAAGCTQADQSPPGGQCRHQQVCIQGFGAALVCKSGCTPTCGGTAVLTASVAGGSPNYTFVLHADDGSADQTFGPTSNTSHDFTVTVTQNTTYTLTVTDSNGCSRTATTSLSATAVAKPTLSRTGPDCAGNATITVTNCDASLTYTWYDNGVLISGASGCTLTQQFAPGSHSITVTASNAGGTCTATSDPNVFTVNPAVGVTLVQTSAPCSGVVTLTATGSGGNGSYTFTFTGASGTVNGNTITLQPQLDGACRTVTVTATSAGCTSSPASYSFSQCVTTTAC